MVRISLSVFVSNIETGLLLEKPCPDLGSIATPFPPVPGISPTGASDSRSNTVMRPGTAGRAALVSVAGTARVPPRGMYSRRPSASAKM